MKRILLSLITLLGASHALCGGAAFLVAGKAAPPQPKARAIPVLRIESYPASLEMALRLAPLKAAAGPVVDTGDEKRLRVGSRRDVAAETETALGPATLHWLAAPGGGLAARIALTSPGAASLRLGLRIRDLPAGTELRMSGSASPERIAGPIAGADAIAIARAIGAYWTPLTEGETQSLEIWVPAGADPARARIEVESASHLVATPAQIFKSAAAGVSEPCNEDVVCVASSNPALAQAARSVAKMLFTENGVSYFCTGTLMSDGDAASEVPYLFTAAHCIGTQAAAATLNTFWFFEATSCGGKAASRYSQLAGGATLLYANATSDVALVRLSDRAPDGAWFSGWDATPLAAGSALVALHHPAGDLKKLSIGEAMGTIGAAAGASYSSAAWTTGSTEGGSSGSGIFTLANGEYVLRGGLKGGSASCTSSGHKDDPSNRDYYSRIDMEAATLKSYLAAGPAPLEDYTGLWFNPDEPGWGLTITQDSTNHVFAAWYTFDSDSRPMWIVLTEGRWRGVAALEGTLYRATGTAFDRPYDRARFSVSPVGTGRIDFGQDGSAALTFTVDGRTVTKTVRRQAI